MWKNGETVPQNGIKKSPPFSSGGTKFWLFSCNLLSFQPGTEQQHFVSNFLLLDSLPIYTQLMHI